jgi:hypothetical protein
MRNIENKVFDVMKGRGDVRGFWKDEAGKVYKDNISLYAPASALDLENKVNDLFFRGEKAVFVRGVSKAFVLYPDNKQDVLTVCHSFNIERGQVKPSFVKKLLRDFGGFTVYKSAEGFLFETWEK